MATAEECKTQGNTAFKEGRYELAAQHFTAAIALDGSNAVLFSNRSGAFASLGTYLEVHAMNGSHLQLRLTMCQRLTPANVVAALFPSIPWQLCCHQWFPPHPIPSHTSPHPAPGYPTLLLTWHATSSHLSSRTSPPHRIAKKRNSSGTLRCGEGDHTAARLVQRLLPQRGRPIRPRVRCRPIESHHIQSHPVLPS